MTLTLHPHRGITRFGYDGKEIEGVNWYRATAMVVDRLGKFILKNRIPACFPNSVGYKYWYHDQPEDYSEIVYYKPRKPSLI